MMTWDERGVQQYEETTDSVQGAMPWSHVPLAEMERQLGEIVSDDDNTKEQGTTPTTAARNPRSLQVMPESERKRMLGITAFLRQARDNAKMTNEQIAIGARARVPLIAVGTVTHLLLPKHMSKQSDVGYRLLSAVLAALGSSHAELESYLRLEADAGNGQSVERFTHEQQEERALLQNFRRLSPLHRTWLIRHAQEYAGLDGLGMIADALAEADDEADEE